MGLGLVILFGGIAFIDAAITGRDIRCMIQRVFDRSIDCPKNESASLAQTAQGLPGSLTLSPLVPSGRHVRPQGFIDTGSGNSATNLAKAMAVGAAVKAHFGSRVRWNPATPNICNCRKQRGTGSDPGRWSVHSVCGAVDVWPIGGNAAEIIRYAKTLPGVWDAWLDESPGDVHIQVIPNPPSNWVPPCAGGKPLP